MPFSSPADFITGPGRVSILVDLKAGRPLAAMTGKGVMSRVVVLGIRCTPAANIIGKGMVRLTASEMTGGISSSG